MTSSQAGEQLPRLIRRVPDGTLPGKDVLAILDPKQNLLRVNSYLFEKLTDEEKKLVYRTNETALRFINGRIVSATPTHSLEVLDETE